MPFTNQKLPVRQCSARVHYHFDMDASLSAATLPSLSGQWDVPISSQIRITKKPADPLAFLLVKGRNVA